MCVSRDRGFYPRRKRWGGVPPFFAAWAICERLRHNFSKSRSRIRPKASLTPRFLFILHVVCCVKLLLGGGPRVKGFPDWTSLEACAALPGLTPIASHPNREPNQKKNFLKNLHNLVCKRLLQRVLSVSPWQALRRLPASCVLSVRFQKARKKSNSRRYLTQRQNKRYCAFITRSGHWPLGSECRRCLIDSNEVPVSREWTCSDPLLPF